MSVHLVNSTFFDMSSLPTEIGLRIFSNLNAQDLAVVCLVNNRWNTLTKNQFLLDQLNVKTLFKRVTFIDEAVWQDHVDLGKYGLSFGEYFAEKRKMITELKKCLSWPIEKINGIKPDVTVVIIPKGLSIYKLQNLASRFFIHIKDEIVKMHGANEVVQSYSIIITNNIMEKTRAIPAEKQLKEIEQYEGKAPKAIEFIAAIILTWLNFEKSFFYYDLYQWVTCEEKINDKHISIGCYGTLSLCINTPDSFNAIYSGCIATKRI